MFHGFYISFLNTEKIQRSTWKALFKYQNSKNQKKKKKKQYQKTCRNISEKYEQSKYFSMNHGSNGRVLGGTRDCGRGTVALFA